MTASPPSPAQGNEFEYDVFVSYRQREPDATWVRTTLVPRLTAAGLRVFVDYEAFVLGRPLVKEMARGVEQSRYTLAVLTPNYLESNFTDLESVLAEHLGLEKSQRRLLAIMREASIPRLGIRARLWFDMTDDRELDASIGRLVTELRRPPEA